MKQATLQEKLVMWPKFDRIHDLIHLMEMHGPVLPLGRERLGNMIELGEGFTASDYDYINLASVSKRHAFVEKIGEDFTIRDRHSMNGTAIQRKGKLIRLEPDKRYPLHDKDELYFGGQIRESEQPDIKKSYGPVVFSVI